MAKSLYVLRLVTISMCLGVVLSFSILDKLKEEQDKDIDARIIYLVNILRQIKKLRLEQNKISDGGGGIQIKKVVPASIDLQKKNYAILPPSSEWCRMMGFRSCRQHS